MRTWLAIVAFAAACGPSTTDPQPARGGGPAVKGGDRSGAGAPSDAEVIAAVRRYDSSARQSDVEVERSKLAVLPGLTLYHVTVLVPDHPGHRCAGSGQDVWCDGAMLPAVAAAFSLGSKPGQLGDPELVDLCAFLAQHEPLRTAGAANLLQSYAPAEALAKVTAPAVTQRDGVRVTYFVESVAYAAYPSGPKSLSRVEIHIGADDRAALDTQVIWEGR
jgi:hypothetical protein